MPHVRHKRSLAVAIAACLLAVGCASPTSYYRCDDPPQRPKVDPRDVWKCNVEVMRRIVKGGDFSLREFWGAAAFFEELTGIPADARETHYGRVPGPELRDSLRSWNDWYLQHGERLVWDSATGKVRLPAPDEAGS